ncbi:MAG: Rne/Rng family ribonuclease [Anaeromyxobacteraceae bacterium]
MAGNNILVINASGAETRVALVENGTIHEYYLERKREKGIVGNIYKGRVVRVLPGMQAAFVDIGLEKAAFLYVGDVYGDPDFSEEFELTEGEHATETPEVPDEHEAEEAEARAAQAAAQPTVTPAHGIELALTPAPGAPLSPAAGEGQGEGAATLSPTVGEGTLHEEHPLSPTEGGDQPSDTARASAGEGQPTDTARSSAGEGQPTDISLPPTGGEGQGEGAASIEELPPPRLTPIPLTNAIGNLPVAGIPDLMVPELPPIEAGAEAPPSTPSLSAPPPPQAGDAAQVTVKAPEAAREVRGERDRDRERGGRREGRHGKEGREGRDREQGRGGRNGHREERKPREPKNIQDLLKEGQEVIVQVAKDPIGTKGARITSHISLPGRHLVFMPTVDHIGISRRIEKDGERRRLREIVDRMRPEGTGFIVRTVADGVESQKLEADIRFLINVWNEIIRTKDKVGAPALLHGDLDLILRATRDLFTADIHKMVIDDRDEFERILKFVKDQAPHLESQIECYRGDEPIFDAFGIEQELRRASQRKVWLKSGGYIIMDQAEALTAIDVNSGRYVGKKNLEETITKINVEAAKEIVYQLRLRNIGGIIIIDFIDMDKPQNRDKVFKSLQEALGRDKAKTNVLKISELGLVEMTRKRVRESVTRMLAEPCSYCDGKGHTKSKITVAYEIFREIRRDSPHYPEPVLVVNCHPEVARIIQGPEREELRYLMDRFNKTIQVKPQQNYHQEQFDIYGRQERGEQGKEPGPSEPGRGEPGRGEQGRGESGRGESGRDRDQGRDRDRRGGRGQRGGRGGGGDRGPRGGRGEEQASREPKDGPRESKDAPREPTKDVPREPKDPSNE